MKEVLVTIATLLALIGYIPYLKDIIKNKIHPHPFTWLVWSIVSCITFFGALAKGAGLAAIPIFVSEVFTIIIFLWSLKNGFKHVKKIDVVFLVFALGGLIPWYLTNDPTLSVIIAVTIDLLAFVPTVRKTYLHPKSENYILYAMGVLRHLCIMFSLDTYNIATTLHSVVMITTNSIMTYIIKFRKIFK